MRSFIQPLSSIDGDTRADWMRVVAKLGLNPSLAPGWLEVAVRSLNRYAATFVFVEYRADGSLTGVVPFFMRGQRMAGMRMSVLELAYNLVSNHAEIVTQDNHASLLRRFLDAAPRWDIFQANGVPAGGPTATAIVSVADQLRVPLQTTAADVSPYLPISSTWQSFLASQNKKFRYKVRRRRELLQEREDLHLSWYTNEAGVSKLLNDMLLIESQCWKVKSGIDIASSPSQTEYHRQLLPFLAREGMLLANVLYIAQTPVAYSLCCHRDGWVGQLKTSFDEAYAEWSPGSIVIDASVEKAFELCAHEFDFLGHSAQHKLIWSSRTRAHSDYFLFAPRCGPRLLGILKSLRNRARNLKSGDSRSDAPHESATGTG